MSESDKEGGDPSSVSSIPPLLTDDGTEESGKGSVYRYRDFSHVGKDDDGELAADNPPPPPTAAARGNSESSIRVQKFPVKLYAILGQREFNDIISWMPHGRSWKVLKPNLFESMVMPLFFEYSNYHSFNRLVNAWSFRRISSGPDRGSYYHELFLRGMPHLQKYMRRLPKTSKKLPMSKKDEPDFYALDKKHSLPPVEAAPIPGAAATSAAVRNQRLQQQQVNSTAQFSPHGTHGGPPPQPGGPMGNLGPGGPAPPMPPHVMTRYMGQQVDEYFDPSMMGPTPGFPNGMGAPPMATGAYSNFLPPNPNIPGPMRGGLRQNQHPMEHMMPPQAQMEAFQGGAGYGVPGNAAGFYGSPYPGPPGMGGHGFDGNSVTSLSVGSGGLHPGALEQQQQQHQGESPMMMRRAQRRM